MAVKRFAMQLAIYLLWFGAVFAVLFVARGRLIPSAASSVPALLLIASAMASGITIAQAIRKRR